MFADDFHIVLHQPVIPQNTGSIARLCACTGAKLHLVHPLGFKTDAASVKRAGLDYWEHVAIREHASWEEFLTNEEPASLYLFTKFADQSLFETRMRPGAYLIFGSETKGLPQEVHDQFPDHRIQIPMRTHLVRSLNLAQSAAIALYEAMRQKL